MCESFRYAAVNLGLYDSMRAAYTRITGEERCPVEMALVFGALSGVASSTVTFPLEVVRRRRAQTGFAMRS